MTHAHQPARRRVRVRPIRTPRRPPLRVVVEFAEREDDVAIERLVDALAGILRSA